MGFHIVSSDKTNFHSSNLSFRARKTLKTSVFKVFLLSIFRCFKRFGRPEFRVAAALAGILSCSIAWSSTIFSFRLVPALPFKLLPAFYPELKGIVGPHMFGYNKRTHILHFLLYIPLCAVIAGICMIFKTPLRRPVIPAIRRYVFRNFSAPSA